MCPTTPSNRNSWSNRIFESIEISEAMKKMIEEAEKLGVEITTLLCPGALPDLTPPALVVVAGAFLLFLRALGAKWGWMLRWMVAGGGSALNIIRCSFN